MTGISISSQLRGRENEVLAYMNDGKGNFSLKTLFRNIGRNYNVKLWDFDQDGYLDMFIDGHEEPLKVFWGSRNGFSSRRSGEIEGFDQHLMQDMAFGQFTSGFPQAAVLSSYKIGFAQFERLLPVAFPLT